MGHCNRYFVLFTSSVNCKYLSYGPTRLFATKAKPIVHRNKWKK